MYHPNTDLSFSQSPPAPAPAQAGTPRAGCPGPRPGGFWRSPSRRPHNLSVQPVPGLRQRHSKTVFSYVQITFLVFQHVPLASCPVAGQYNEILRVFLCYMSLFRKASQLCASLELLILALGWHLPVNSSVQLRDAIFISPSGITVSKCLKHPLRCSVGGQGQTRRYPVIKEKK